MPAHARVGSTAIFITAIQAAIIIAVMAKAVHFVFQKLDSKGRPRRRFLVLEPGGKRTWQSAEDSDGAGFEDECSVKTPLSPTATYSPPKCVATYPLGLQNAVSGTCVSDQAVEHRIVAGVAVRRALAVYVRLLHTGTIYSGESWWPKDEYGRVELDLDPEAVLCAIASLTRRAVMERAEEIIAEGAMGGDVTNEVMRAAVGVGHKLASCLECLHPRQGNTLGRAIARELQIREGNSEDRQALAEVSLVTRGHSLSCVAFNLAASFDLLPPVSPHWRDRLLAKGTSRVLHVALLVDFEVRLDLLVAVHGCADVESAFVMAVRETCLPFVQDFSDLGIKETHPLIKNVALEMIRAGARSGLDAFTSIIPPSMQDANELSIGRMITFQAFDHAIRRLSS